MGRPATRLREVVSPKILDTTGAEQTEALGAQLAAQLQPGDVVLLRGDLGTCKTTFVRGAARALGVSGPISSPTFSIGHRYIGERPDGARVLVSHVDLYRIVDPLGEEPELLGEYLDGVHIAFVEWPSEGVPELGGARMTITLSHLGEDRRRIELDDRRPVPGR
jgi:tRNA threonylcarbamoyladenosine biosynthesis protein TsaE